MQQFPSLLSWRLFIAQHVSGVLPPIIRSSMTAVAASGFTFVPWWQLRCVCGGAGPRTKHGCHHDTKVKPEAATAIIELLMMGGKTHETCWAVNKCQDNKLENCCIWLVIYLKYTPVFQTAPKLCYWSLSDSSRCVRSIQARSKLFPTLIIYNTLQFYVFTI